ncbi:ATP synthase subunit alpha [Frankliniella fusca]|uniref:ATP synthase subunit alpha n=1 Tax=Frankliniella fusca TaxID=407009 RepID=A0AAE1I3Z0_9NEOP|nr:ATP synthase subunit alpha [Frankliniella fusca]
MPTHYSGLIYDRLLVPEPLSALKDMRIVLPTAARVGATTRLSCLYDLEGSQLYSIKWYREEAEFYSFVPKEQPATRLYPDHGISVDAQLPVRERTIPHDQRPAIAVSP